MLDDIASAYELSNRSDDMVNESNMQARAAAKQLTAMRQKAADDKAAIKTQSDEQTNSLDQIKDSVDGFVGGHMLLKPSKIVEGMKTGSVGQAVAGELDSAVAARTGGRTVGDIVQGAQNSASFFRKMPKAGGAASTVTTAAQAEGSAASRVLPDLDTSLGYLATTPRGVAAEALQRSRSRLNFLNTIEPDQGTVFSSQVARVSDNAAATTTGAASAAASTAASTTESTLGSTAEKLGSDVAKASRFAQGMKIAGAVPGAVDAFQDLTNTKNGKWDPTLKGDNWQQKAGNALSIASTVMDFVPGMEWAGALGGLASAGLSEWGDEKDKDAIKAKDAAPTVAPVQPTVHAGLNYHALGLVANQSNNAMNSIHSAVGAF